MRNLFFMLAFCSLALFALNASAGRCNIFNDTDTAFSIESGNISNQSVGSHTHTSIQAGKIIGKSNDGKSVGGSCKDGDKIKVVKEKDVFIILPQ